MLSNQLACLHLVTMLDGLMFVEFLCFKRSLQSANVSADTSRHTAGASVHLTAGGFMLILLIHLNTCMTNARLGMV